MGTTFGLLLLCQARQEQWPQGLSSCRSDLEHGTVQSQPDKLACFLRALAPSFGVSIIPRP